jgi:hypothetical protein
MTDRGWIEPIVERVVREVLDTHVSQLRQEIIRRVCEEVEAAPEVAGPPRETTTNTAVLAQAVAEIQLGSSQREILRALLDACAGYAARVALFVVKGTQATGWQARGFSKNDSLKEFTLDTNCAAVGRAMHERVAVKAKAGEIDDRFIHEFGAPGNEEAYVLPLLLKGKVAALVYADAGVDSTGRLESGSVELLALATSAWLEVNSLRKLSHREPMAEVSERPQASAAPAAPAVNDPFAAHTPSHAKAAAAAATAQGPATEASPLGTRTEEETAAPEQGKTSEDEEVHRKAQRFARLLVDEIKLYNQARVAEGRKNKDLYDRLKEAIEKSRATYQRRYGNTLAGSGKYFEDELIRSLAEDDVSVMGANFQR